MGAGGGAAEPAKDLLAHLPQVVPRRAGLVGQVQVVEGGVEVGARPTGVGIVVVGVRSSSSSRRG